MNKIYFINVFFIVIYISSVFMPIIPLIEYAINYNYIAEVLCENKDIPQTTCSGKCYLKKQVKISIEKKIPNKKENSKTNYIPDFRIAVVHKINKTHFGTPLFLMSVKQNKLLYSSRYLEVEDKPPNFYFYI